METTPNGIPIRSQYSSVGERFILYPIYNRHTQTDVREAKQWLKDNRDVETLPQLYDFRQDIMSQVATHWRETDECPTTAYWSSFSCLTKLIALTTTGWIMEMERIVEPIYTEWLFLTNRTDSDLPRYVALCSGIAFVWLPDLPFVNQATFDLNRSMVMELYQDYDLYISYDQPAESSYGPDE